MAEDCGWSGWVQVACHRDPCPHLLHQQRAGVRGTLCPPASPRVLARLLAALLLLDELRLLLPTCCPLLPACCPLLPDTALSPSGFPSHSVLHCFTTRHTTIFFFFFFLAGISSCREPLLHCGCRPASGSKNAAKLDVLGLRGKVLVTGGLQGWLL